MQSYFHDTADYLGELIAPEQVYLARFNAEESDFVRLTGSAVRQAGSVSQCYFGVQIIDGKRHVSRSVTVSGSLKSDRARLREVVASLQDELAVAPEDPHLSYSTEAMVSELRTSEKLPDRARVLESILEAGAGRDLVGLYAAGPVHVGFASSLGHRNWFSSASFNFDWSFFLDDDRAVKCRYAGDAWDDDEFAARVERAARQLEILKREPRTIAPGEYRVYLAPTALDSILTVLAWRSFSLRGQRTGQSSLLDMIDGDRRLHGDVSIAECPGAGRAPNFNADGFLKPERVELIEEGQYRQSLVSPRSSVEYDVATNGADNVEVPATLEMAPGDLAADDVHGRIGDGLAIDNLHYLNFSDRRHGRITGMTRFASFLVENGEPVAPIAPMRFDESIYNILGERLVALTAERQLIPESHTYGGRSTATRLLPGALVKDFTLAL